MTTQRYEIAVSATAEVAGWQVSMSAGAIALAGVSLATLILAGRPWGITSAFALWGAKIAAALDVSESKAKEQQAQIAELGRRLNLALASKVQELARYRSEFFGRLREIIGAGIVPFATSLAQRTNKLVLDSPELVKPGQTTSTRFTPPWARATSVGSV